MHPSDRLLNDLDEWADRTKKDSPARRRESLGGLLTHSLRGATPEFISEILDRWATLRGGPEGEARAQAWVNASALLIMMDYDDSPPLSREDWSRIREIISTEAETLDMEVVSYVMERVLDHGGF